MKKFLGLIGLVLGLGYFVSAKSNPPRKEIPIPTSFAGYWLEIEHCLRVPHQDMNVKVYVWTGTRHLADEYGNAKGAISDINAKEITFMQYMFESPRDIRHELIHIRIGLPTHDKWVLDRCGDLITWK